MDFELYAIVGQFDGSGFAMAYLFVEGVKKDEGARKDILKLFFQSLKNHGISNLAYFITDKDFAQITAAQHVWPNVKIQICLWHIKKALKRRLADNTPPKSITYSSYAAHEIFNFIDIEFHPPLPSVSNIQRRNFTFCPKDLRQKVIDLLERHLHWHPLIPNTNGQFLTSEEIWTNSVNEMYQFCFNNELRYVWAYLWVNWYQKEMWNLWARSSAIEICIFRTTMLTESHWKVLKRDYLPKFFKPRLDLVIYVILSRLIPHHKQQYNKYINKRERVSWRKDFKKEWNTLVKRDIKGNYATDIEKWICSCPSFLLNRFFLCKHLVQKSQFEITPKFFCQIRRQGTYPFLTFQENTMDGIPATDNFVNTSKYYISHFTIIKKC